MAGMLGSPVVYRAGVHQRAFTSSEAAVLLAQLRGTLSRAGGPVDHMVRGPHTRGSAAQDAYEMRSVFSQETSRNLRRGSRWLVSFVSLSARDLRQDRRELHRCSL
jgi:hypothetical protein